MGSIVVGLSDSCTWQANSLSCPSLHDFVSGKAFLGDLLALIGAWMAAGYILIGRRLRTHMSLVPYIFMVYGVAAIILIIIMFAVGYSPWGYSSINPSSYGLGSLGGGYGLFGGGSTYNTWFQPYSSNFSYNPYSYGSYGLGSSWF